MTTTAILHATQWQSSPLLSNAFPCALAALALQATVGLPSTFLVKTPTEKLYDLTGATGHVAVAVLGLCLPRWRRVAAGLVVHPLHWRQRALATAVTLWAVRLGTYLVRRILRDGQDARFDLLRASPGKMALAWAAQAVWIVLCQMPVTAVHATGGTGLPDAVLWTDVLGLVLFAAGLALECVADYQRASWVQAKRCKAHDEAFMARGLFSRSQYPHYFGETVLWTGVAVAAGGVLATDDVRKALGGVSVVTSLAVAAVSPAFTAFILLKLSGVPLSEAKYDRRYGGRADYQAWKRSTPKFFPKLL